MNIPKNNSSNISLSRLKIYFYIMVLYLGLNQAWNGRYTVDPDGLSYIDIGDAFFRGDFKHALSVYWSPLYPLITGFALYLFKPAPYWESIFLHGVNFLIYLFTFLCFEYFLKSVIKYQKKKENKFPEWAWYLFGYSLFVWVTMNLIGLSRLTPDMSVSAMVYLISGIIIRIKSGISNYFMFLFLGVALGISYLFKTAMFPISFVFLLVTFFSVGNIKIALPRTLISLFIFLLISSPLIYTLSKSNGYATFGDSGRLTYTWYTNETYQCWKEGYPNCPKLIHPVKKVFNEPAVYDYSEHAYGSYPMWYDPAYWFSGLKLHFDLQGQLNVFLREIEKYYELFFQMQGFLIVSFLLLFFMTGRGTLCFKDIMSEWVFLVPALFTMSMYSFVMVQYRYLGAFNLLLWMGLFSALKLPDTKTAKDLLSSMVIVLAVFMFVTGAISYDFLKEGKHSSSLMHFHISEALKKSGVKEGDKVGVIGLEYGMYWARLLKAHVVAEIPTEEENNFYLLSDFQKNEVYNKFRKAGAKVLVSERGPSYLSRIGWKNIKDTPYYFYLL